MKNYAIIIRDKEQCEKVDRLLEMGGIVFMEDCPEALEHPYLRIIPPHGNLQYADEGIDLYDSINFACSRCWCIFSADQFLTNPTIIPYWKKQEERMIEIDGKEYSESTIQRAMQEYCRHKK